MRYISTRGRAPALEFDDLLLTGLARDGGLYLPESWPRMTADQIIALRGLDYPELATRIMLPFVGTTLTEGELRTIVHETYDGFDHRAVAPLRQVGQNLWVMELFHGPTLAFKDYAMQFLGRVFDHVLTKRGERVTIVGATSGDTGSAAIEACKNRDAIDVFILYPEGRVSEVQRRQMTTVTANNVHCIAVKGTFDDCQNMIKDMFADLPFRDEIRMSAVNSINWARVMAQIVYYFWAGLHLGAPERKVSFSVPSGNFGNAFAGYCAREMGLPIEQIVIGANANDILARFFTDNAMTMKEVIPTTSPSMDILISSNFERILAEYYSRDGEEIERLMNRFRQSGSYTIDDTIFGEMCEFFSAASYTDGEVGDIIDETWLATGTLIDTHTAIGLAAAEGRRKNHTTPMVALSTAHPAKFPDAVEKACGIRPGLPSHMADLLQRKEHFVTLENDIGAVQAYIRKHRR